MHGEKHKAARHKTTTYRGLAELVDFAVLALAVLDGHVNLVQLRLRRVRARVLDERVLGSKQEQGKTQPASGKKHTQRTLSPAQSPTRHVESSCSSGLPICRANSLNT